MVAGFSWVDGALAAVLAISVLVGLWRGLVYELLSLIGWVVAVVVAKAYGGAMAPWLPVGAAGGWARLAVSYAVTFFAVLIIWSLLAKLARMMTAATPLSVVDRALGAGFGLARGLLILLALALAVTLIPPVAQSAAWQASRGAAWLGAMLHGLKPWWPAAEARQSQSA